MAKILRNICLSFVTALLFVSCLNYIEAPEEKSSKKEDFHSYIGTINSNLPSSRAVVPDLNVLSGPHLTYKVYAVNSKNKRVEADVIYPEFYIVLEDGSWTVYVEAYAKDATKPVLKGSKTLVLNESQSFPQDFSVDAYLITDALQKGTVNLKIKSTYNKISKIIASWKENGTTYTQTMEKVGIGDFTFTMTPDSLKDSLDGDNAGPRMVSSGVYDVSFSCYGDLNINGSSSEKQLYGFVQIINVYGNLCSDSFSSDISGEQGLDKNTIVISEAVSRVNSKSVYVSENGNDASLGDLYHPVRNLDYAMRLIEYFNDGTSDYTIYLDGNVSSKASLSPSKELKLKLRPQIKAKGANLIVDAAKTMDFSEKLDLTMENLTFTGSGTTSELLDSAVNFNAKNLIVENCSFSNITSHASGAAISGSDTSKISVKNSKFQNCNSYSGGGIFVDSDSNLLFEDSSFSNSINSENLESGIYVKGDVELGGQCNLDSRCRIFLEEDKIINLGKELSSSVAGKPVAYLYPQVVKEDSIILSLSQENNKASVCELFSYDERSCAKDFLIDFDGNSNALISQFHTIYVKTISGNVEIKNGSKTAPYTNLYEAIESLKNKTEYKNDRLRIKLLSDVTITSTLDIDNFTDLTICSSDITLKRNIKMSDDTIPFFSFGNGRVNTNQVQKFCLSNLKISKHKESVFDFTKAINLNLVSMEFSECISPIYYEKAGTEDLSEINIDNCSFISCTAKDNLASGISYLNGNLLLHGNNLSFDSCSQNAILVSNGKNINMGGANNFIDSGISLLNKAGLNIKGDFESENEILIKFDSSYLEGATVFNISDPETANEKVNMFSCDDWDLLVSQNRTNAYIKSILKNYIYVSSKGDDTTGRGSAAKPYKTLQAAYNKALSLYNDNVGDLVLYLKSDIDFLSPLDISEIPSLAIRSVSGQYAIKGNGTSYLCAGYKGNDRTAQVIESVIFDNLKTIEVKSHLNMEDCIIQKAKNSGIRVLTGDASLNLSRCVFSENEGTKGAAIYVEGGSLVVKDNSSFNSNVASSSGGAIYAKDANINISQTQIGLSGKTEAAESTSFSNKALINGGGIFAEGTSTIVLNSSTTVQYNYAEKNGGGICIGDSNTNLKISDSHIIYNTAHGSGGGIYINASGYSSMKNVSFRTNMCDEDGGAMFVDSGINLIGTLTLDENKSSRIDGIKNIFVSPNGKLLFNDINNKTKLYLGVSSEISLPFTLGETVSGLNLPNANIFIENEDVELVPGLSGIYKLQEKIQRIKPISSYIHKFPDTSSMKFSSIMDDTDILREPDIGEVLLIDDKNDLMALQAYFKAIYNSERRPGVEATNVLAGVTLLQTNNIDLYGEIWEGLGNDADAFSGIYDGNGYVISNMDLVGTSGPIGFFGKISGAEIHNMILGGRIRINSPTPTRDIGGLVGRAIGWCSIENCQVYVDYIGDNYCVGGFVGALEVYPDANGNYRNTNFDLEIKNCANYGNLSANGVVGGFIGNVALPVGESKISIMNCVNFGRISTLNTASDAAGSGGFIGKFDCPHLELINCFNAGIVETHISQNKGGLIGSYTTESPVTKNINHCYFISAQGGDTQNLSSAADYVLEAKQDGATYVLKQAGSSVYSKTDICDILNAWVNNNPDYRNWFYKDNKIVFDYIDLQ